MKGFHDFLDALATPGGNLLILCFMVILSGVVLNRFHYSDEIDTVMVSVFSGFSGALLAALTGRLTSKGTSLGSLGTEGEGVKKSGPGDTPPRPTV